MNNKFSSNSAAYLLVSHGSRDRNHGIAVRKLANSIARQLETSINIPRASTLSTDRRTVLIKPETPIIATAQLELAEMPLYESIEQLAVQLKRMDIKRLYVLPLFLLPGIHVKEDIPAEIATARVKLKDTITIELLPYLGSNGSLTDIIETQFAKIPLSERILISHGSTRQGGNRPCEEIALRLNANTAYCRTHPSLRETVLKIAATGKKKIAVVPYFLFAGKILKSIATEIAALEKEFPNIDLFLGESLATTPELTNSIVRRIK